MNPTPTQVQHPWRTTFRTVVWLVIALAPSVPTAWSIAQDEASKAGLVIPPSVAAGIAYAVTVIVFLVALVQRVVLIPGVAQVIEKLPGLRALPPAPDPVPEHAIEPSTVAHDNVATHTAADGTQTDTPL